MKKKLRLISFAMLVIGVVFVVLAFLSMGVPMDLLLPVAVLKVIYGVYPVVTVGIFVLSFFVPDKKSKK